jgi:hypothetical protein
VRPLADNGQTCPCRSRPSRSRNPRPSWPRCRRRRRLPRDQPASVVHRHRHGPAGPRRPRGPVAPVRLVASASVDAQPRQAQTRRRSERRHGLHCTCCRPPRQGRSLARGGSRELPGRTCPGCSRTSRVSVAVARSKPSHRSRTRIRLRVEVALVVLIGNAVRVRV